MKKISLLLAIVMVLTSFTTAFAAESFPLPDNDQGKPAFSPEKLPQLCNNFKLISTEEQGDKVITSLKLNEDVPVTIIEEKINDEQTKYTINEGGNENILIDNLQTGTLSIDGAEVFTKANEVSEVPQMTSAGALTPNAAADHVTLTPILGSKSDYNKNGTYTAYSGTSGRRFRKHPDTKPEASGHFAG